jgi:periplasmic divalent cation tolerance protein
MPKSETSQFSMVITTVSSMKDAEQISEHIVSNREAACVNIIGPLISVFKWNNKIEKEKEFILLIKTKTESINSITKTIKMSHTYKVPEIISFPFESHNDDYSQWVFKSLEKMNTL